MGYNNQGLAMTAPLWRVMLQASDKVIETATTMDEEDRAIGAAHLRVIMNRLFPDGKGPPPWLKGEYRIWRELQSEIDKCQSIDNTQQIDDAFPIRATMIGQRRSTMPR